MWWREGWPNQLPSILLKGPGPLCKHPKRPVPMCIWEINPTDLWNTTGSTWAQEYAAISCPEMGSFSFTSKKRTQTHTSVQDNPNKQVRVTHKDSGGHCMHLFFFLCEQKLHLHTGKLNTNAQCCRRLFFFCYWQLQINRCHLILHYNPKTMLPACQPATVSMPAPTILDQEKCFGRRRSTCEAKKQEGLKCFHFLTHREAKLLCIQCIQAKWACRTTACLPEWIHSTSTGASHSL